MPNSFNSSRHTLTNIAITINNTSLETLEKYDQITDLSDVSRSFVKSYTYNNRNNLKGGLGNLAGSISSPLYSDYGNQSLITDGESSTFGGPPIHLSSHRPGHRLNRLNTIREDGIGQHRNDFKYDLFSCLKNRTSCCYGLCLPFFVFGLIKQKLHDKINLPFLKLRSGGIARLNTCVGPNESGLFSYGGVPSSQRKRNMHSFSQTDNGLSSDWDQLSQTSSNKFRAKKDFSIAIFWGILTLILFVIYVVYIVYELICKLEHSSDNNSKNSQRENNLIDFTCYNLLLYICVLAFLINGLLMFYSRIEVRQNFRYQEHASHDLYASFCCWYCSLWQISNEIKIQKDIRYFSRLFFPNASRQLSQKKMKLKRKGHEFKDRLHVPGRSQV